MTPERLMRTAIAPALADLSDLGIPDTREARRLLVAIALQESGLLHRRQMVGGRESGPAASWFQFEQGGGCRGVLTHPSARDKMLTVCRDYGIEPTEAGLWEAMRYHDIVATVAARLLVYTLPFPLPQTSEQGWRQYLSAWRPGKPRLESWAACWERADRLTKERS